MRSNLCAYPVILLCISLSTACSGIKSQKNSNQSRPAVKTQTQTATAIDPLLPGTADAAGDGGINSDEDIGAAAANEQVFDIFCQNAAKTKVVEERLGAYYDKFCPNGEPSGILKNTLISVAYDGTDVPRLKLVEDWKPDPAAGTTTGYLALGIKIPIKIQDHFQKVGPKAGDPETMKQVLAGSGGTVDIANILESFKEDGPHHVRGWLSEQRVGRQLPGIPIKLYTHTTNRLDQYELEPGVAYLYSSYVAESKESIKEFDIFTAGLQLGDDAYLLTLSRVVLENQGFHEIATVAIQVAANELVKQMYNAAAQEK